MDNEKNQEKPLNRVIAYIRKSSEDNEKGEASKQLNSIEYQRTFIKEAVQKYKLKIIRQFEDDKSAYEAFERPNFNDMLDYLKEHRSEIDGLVCTEISRLARNFADGGMILWYMQDDIIKRIYTPSKIFTNSSSDQMMVAIEIAMSKKSSDDTGYRTKEGMKSKAMKMKHPSRPAVLGYKTIGPVGAKEWVLNEETAPLVRKVFEQFSTGKYNLKQISEYAFNIGLRSKDNKSVTKKYSPNTWLNRLGDEQYIGFFEQSDERIVGEYEHLIDDITFYKVQQLLSGNKHPKSTHIEYAYTGLVKCGLCGDPLSGTNKKGITYYRCAKRKAPCKDIRRNSYVPESTLEASFIERFNKIEIDEETWTAARKYVVELNKPEKLNLEKDIRMLSVQLGNEEQRQIEFGIKFTDNLISKSEHDRLMENSYHKEASLRNSIVKCENVIHELNELMEDFLENIKYVTQKLQTSLPENKREMVEIFCENLVWKDGKAQFDWKKPYYFIAKQPKNSTVLPR